MKMEYVLKNENTNLRSFEPKVEIPKKIRKKVMKNVHSRVDSNYDLRKSASSIKRG